MSDRRKLLRQMTGAYLARPDPVAWLAAADIYEEEGDARSASLWRNRGKLFPVLQAEYRKFWESAKGNGWVRERPERFLLGDEAVLIGQNATHSSFVVELLDNSGGPCTVYLRRAYEPGTRYVTAKLMNVVNRVIARHGGEE